MRNAHEITVQGTRLSYCGLRIVDYNSPPYISLNRKTVDWLIGKKALPEIIGGRMIGTNLHFLKGTLIVIPKGY